MTSAKQYRSVPEACWADCSKAATRPALGVAGILGEALRVVIHATPAFRTAGADERARHVCFEKDALMEPALVVAGQLLAGPGSLEILRFVVVNARLASRAALCVAGILYETVRFVVRATPAFSTAGADERAWHACFGKEALLCSARIFDVAGVDARASVVALVVAG